MGKFAKLAGCKPEVEIAPSMSGIFCRNLLHLEILLELGSMAWYGVVDLTKFSIVVYGEICKDDWLQTGSGNRAVDVGHFFWSNFAPPGNCFNTRKYGLVWRDRLDEI